MRALAVLSAIQPCAATKSSVTTYLMATDANCRQGWEGSRHSRRGSTRRGACPASRCLPSLRVRRTPAGARSSFFPFSLSSVASCWASLMMSAAISTAAWPASSMSLAVVSLASIISSADFRHLTAVPTVGEITQRFFDTALDLIQIDNTHFRHDMPLRAAFLPAPRRGCGTRSGSRSAGLLSPIFTRRGLPR